MFPPGREAAVCFTYYDFVSLLTTPYIGFFGAHPRLLREDAGTWVLRMIGVTCVIACLWFVGIWRAGLVSYKQNDHVMIQLF